MAYGIEPYIGSESTIFNLQAFEHLIYDKKCFFQPHSELLYFSESKADHKNQNAGKAGPTVRADWQIRIPIVYMF